MKILFAHLKSLEMRMLKLLLDWLDLSVAQMLPEKINKIFLPNRLGFIDVLSTVYDFYKFRKWWVMFYQKSLILSKKLICIWHSLLTDYGCSFFLTNRVCVFLPYPPIKCLFSPSLFAWESCLSGDPWLAWKSRIRAESKL